MEELKQIEHFYRLATQAAEREIVRLSATIMRKRKYSKFYISMGSYFFEDRNGENVDLDELNGKAENELSNLLSDWDDVLKLSGWGVYILPDGVIVDY